MRLLTILTAAILFFSQQTYADFKNDALNAHNQVRAKHHAPALSWSPLLAAYAQHHANRCQFQHSRGPYGENIAAGYPSMQEVVNAWISEEKHYSYWMPGFSYRTGHFTQVVWRNTRRLGCAYANCKNKGMPGIFWVCEYDPRGNIVSRSYFRKNVLAR